MISRTPELVIENHGSVCLLRPRTDDADRRLRNLVGDKVRWWGNALVCEPRYVADIAFALQNGEGDIAGSWIAAEEHYE